MTAKYELSLRGCTVWVTRPRDLADKLLSLVREVGGKGVHFPVITILPANNPAQEVKNLKDVRHSDVVIFISRNAVIHSFRLLPEMDEYLKNPEVVAVGKGTRKELLIRGTKNVITAADGLGSEAILQHAALQHEAINGKKAIIIRGLGGRELLKDTLSERGSDVRYIEVYRRSLPVIEQEQSRKIWRESTPDIVVVTSVEGLHNLIKLVHNDDHKALFNTRIVVVSKRMQTEAEALGFAVRPLIAKSADDEDLLQAVKQSFEKR